MYHKIFILGHYKCHSGLFYVSGGLWFICPLNNQWNTIRARQHNSFSYIWLIQLFCSCSSTAFSNTLTSHRLASVAILKSALSYVWLINLHMTCMHDTIPGINCSFCPLHKLKRDMGYYLSLKSIIQTCPVHYKVNCNVCEALFTIVVASKS